MEYDDDIALKLKLKYDLAPTTIRGWKSKGHIPDKYFQKKAAPKRLSAKEKEQATALVSLLNHPALVAAAFNPVEGDSKKAMSLFNQKMRGLYSLNDLELKKLKKSVGKFGKNLSLLWLSEAGVQEKCRAVCRMDEIKGSVLAQQAGFSKKEIVDFFDWARGRRKSLDEKLILALATQTALLIDAFEEFVLE